MDPESKEWRVGLFDAPGMAAADRWAIDQAGIPSTDLMEAAGLAVAEAVSGLVGSGPVRVVCGKGNNAGDGIVAARYLSEWGHEVELLLIWDRESLSPDSAANLDRVGAIEVFEGTPSLSRLEASGAIVDAVVGTGFEGEPRGPVSEAIEAIAAAAAPVVACDIPSGVDASTGRALRAPRAETTVTFHGAKVGHFVNPGKSLSGRLVVAPIGIPDDAPGPGLSPVPVSLIGEGILGLLPARGPSSNKFSTGRVSIVGGSRGLTGAVCLAAAAAARAGAGYATALVPASLEPIFEAKLTEVMTLGCPDDDGTLGPTARDLVVEHCEGAAAVVLGSGLGRHPSTGELVGSLVGSVQSPTVLDADGLSLLAGEIGLLRGRPGPTVITPHPGEAARLLGIEPDQVEASRLESALEMAELSGAVVVLKGDDTIVVGPGEVAVNYLPSPALATAGTGDVLAGMVGAFMARGLDPFEAACVAVRCHSAAGRVAAGRVGSAEGVIATDVIGSIPPAMAGVEGTGDPVQGLE